MVYYGEFDAMTADSDENILAKAAPDLILYSGLTLASDYYLDNRAEVFEGKFNQFLTEVKNKPTIRSCLVALTLSDQPTNTVMED